MKSWYLPAVVIGAIVIIGLPLALLSSQKSTSSTSTSTSQTEEMTPESGVTFSVIPLSQVATPGDPVTVEVVMDSLDNQVSGTKFRLQFPDTLTSPQVTIGSVFNDQIDFGGAIVEDDYVEVALARSPGTEPFSQGSVTVATITFQPAASASEPAQLTFDQPNTEIYDINTVNVLNNTYPGTVNF
jgi:hypothetical protein